MSGHPPIDLPIEGRASATSMPPFEADSTDPCTHRRPTVAAVNFQPVLHRLGPAEEVTR